MTKLRLISPFHRYLYQPFWNDVDNDQGWPNVTMTDGLDVYEDADGHIVVRAAVPGVPADKVDVTFEEGVLHISAQHEEGEEERKKRKVVSRMDRITSFEYTTTLPRPVDANSIKANVKDGVVIITAQVAQEAQPKKIAVQSS